MKGFIVALTWPNKFFGKWKYQHKKTYIIPTKFGMMFGFMCLCLLYISFASSNNLMYFYTFFLVGIGVSSLWFTHTNISDVIIEDVEVDDVFAGDKAYAIVTLSNRGKSARHHIHVYYKKEQITVLDEIMPRSSRTVRILLGEYNRGLQPIPRLTLSSTFPFSLLVTWKKFDVQKNFAVFPKRNGQTHFPRMNIAKESIEGEAVEQIRSPDSEFSGHRKFENSDSPRHIDWKAYARTEKLLVKDYQGFFPSEVKIQWHHTAHLKNFEERLSQMAMWVEIAEMKGFHYSFELGPLMIMTSRGRSHYIQCLQHLAEAEKEALA
jgi:uncharacterized protein (DUF58 family)